MGNKTPGQITIRSQSRNIGLSALTAILIAALPKCPLCWMAITGALGMNSAISFAWLQPLAVILLCCSIGALFVRARRSRHGYGPFCLGLAAASIIYLCKFRLNYDPGMYLGGAALLGASIWNALPQRRAVDRIKCHCLAHLSLSEANVSAAPGAGLKLKN